MGEPDLRYTQYQFVVLMFAAEKKHVQDIALDVMKVEGRHAGGGSVGLQTIRDGRSTEGDGEQNLAPFYDIFETIPQEEVATLFVGTLSKVSDPIHLSL